MKVLVVGATGKYAGLVVPELKRRGATVRALVRDAGKADAPKRRGADEVAVGDLADRASLRRAAEGVEGVFHINPGFAPGEADLGVGMVEAAKEAGVRKFVFSGAIHPSLSKMINHAAKRPVEEALYESGLAFTVLQPAMFTQTLDMAWPAVLATGRFGLPYFKTAGACYVDYRDVAEAAALALTTDRLDCGTFELCAPGMTSRVGLVALMAEVLGRPVEAAEPGFDEWADAVKEPAAPRGAAGDVRRLRPPRLPRRQRAGAARSSAARTAERQTQWRAGRFGPGPSTAASGSASVRCKLRQSTHPQHASGPSHSARRPHPGPTPRPQPGTLRRPKAGVLPNDPPQRRWCRLWRLNPKKDRHAGPVNCIRSFGDVGCCSPGIDSRPLCSSGNLSQNTGRR